MKRLRDLSLALAAALALAALPGPAHGQEGDPGRAADAPDGAAVRQVDSLVAAGHLQEAAWAAREAGDPARADSILARLRAVLLSPPVSVTPLEMEDQGVSYTFRLVHPGGIRSIFKVDGSDIFCRHCGADREVAVYGIDRLLGLDLTPMTVAVEIVEPGGDTLAGSAMYFLNDARTPARAGVVGKPDALRFFDAVIGNSDRHQSNWLILPGGRVAAIDHNRAFQYRPISRPKTCWETEVDSIARPGALGEPFRRYRTLPDDSLAAAAGDLDPDLLDRFLSMRDSVVDRIQRRADDPGADLPRESCLHGG